MTADDVVYELRYGLSEMEETSLNVIGDAISQHGDPIFILENTENPGEHFSVVVLDGDVRKRSR